MVVQCMLKNLKMTGPKKQENVKFKNRNHVGGKQMLVKCFSNNKLLYYFSNSFNLKKKHLND